MSRDATKDILTGPETEQLLSADTRGDTPHTRVSLQPDKRWSTETLCLQGGVSSSRLTPQNKSTESNCATQDEATSSNSTVVISSPIVVNSENNDDPPPYSAIPPPYSAIALPNHVNWPYELFSFGDSTDRTTCRMEIPLTPFQTSVTPVTDFHHEGINNQRAFPVPLMSYRFFKFGRRSSFVSREMSFTENEISEKINDRKSRRYNAILVAAAVIIFLMVLSLMVRFVMEKSWWRR